MSERTPYNPLDKFHLAESVANAILGRPTEPLPLPDVFDGAGVYAIYYTGDLPIYREIAVCNRNGKFQWPIYVGKAVPAGARRGSSVLYAPPGRVLYNRLAEHAESISAANNLLLSDFQCRY
ncbi:MAG: Eco29kI family restriction endonuclease, partial [Patescibacteria group bacterium]|nr:Eco29kI family restriction endonuclease [Patescibacteria group bacterium]